MQLVEGESPKGPMPFEDAWKIASQIVDALAYAHEKGVVHRDLKPANIKVTPDVYRGWVTTSIKAGSPFLIRSMPRASACGKSLGSVIGP
jgi:serine/threonine protein kinase